MHWLIGYLMLSAITTVLVAAFMRGSKDGDMTYCLADCACEECCKRKESAPEHPEADESFADLSWECVRFVPNEKSDD